MCQAEIFQVNSLEPHLLRVLNNNLCQSEDVQKKFCKLSAELVTSLGISLKDNQLLVRNSIGQQIQNVLNVNPFVSEWLMEKELKQKSEHFKGNFKLNFSEWNDTVGGHIDLEKAIEWILGKESLKDVIKVDNWSHNCFLLCRFISMDVMKVMSKPVLT